MSCYLFEIKKVNCQQKTPKSSECIVIWTLMCVRERQNAPNNGTIKLAPSIIIKNQHTAYIVFDCSKFELQASATHNTSSVGEKFKENTK